jgi:hypothetical protein
LCQTGAMSSSRLQRFCKKSKHPVLTLPHLTQSTCPLAGVPVADIVPHRLLPYQTESSVKPERRKQYPRNWEILSRQCKEQAGNQCAFCHIRQGAQRISRRTGAVYTVFLHAAHKNHDVGNVTPVLLCLCPTCHGRYDFQYRRMTQQIALERMKHQFVLHAHRASKEQHNHVKQNHAHREPG